MYHGALAVASAGFGQCRLQDGIDIDATTWSQIVGMARSLGLAEDHWVAV